MAVNDGGAGSGAPSLVQAWVEGLGQRPRPDAEVRVVDPTTGGEKGIKIDRFDLIPPEFEDALARHYGEGAKKYADRNWERGYDWHLSLRSVRSHLNAWMKGEDNDAETGTNHLICSIWHLIALYIFQVRGLGRDTIRRRPQFLGSRYLDVPEPPPNAKIRKP